MSKKINDYFIDMTDKVSFVQLKPGTTLSIKDYTVTDDIPLPIVTDTLVDEIKEGNLQEHIKVAHLIEGMIHILGIDLDFKHCKQYKDMLYSFNKNVEDLILYRGLKLYDEENYDLSAIFFRALINLNSQNINGIFNYALSLERIGSKYIDLGDKNKGNVFLEESTGQLERILDIDSNYALAYYKLGYHYRHYGYFQKAKLIWEKYINMDSNNIRVQEIREQLELINDDAVFEEGLNYIYKNEFIKALDIFIPLASKHKKSWNVFYYIGIAYKGSGSYENAVEYLSEAINLGGDDPDIFNELGICLYTIGNVKEAIDIFTRGIEEYERDYKLRFNRGLMYLHLEDMDNAKEDIKFAYKLNPDDPSIKEMAEKII